MILRNKGFTLIELVVVVVVIGILAVTVLPKYIDLQGDADEAVMLSMKGAIASADTLITYEIFLNPERLNNNQNRFTLDSGESIRVRGKLPDGRWNITFSYLVDFDNIVYVTSNDCDDASFKWCARHRGSGWFSNREYATLDTGVVLLFSHLGKT